MKKTLRIRPYARLITMLGDQLIKNELIAIVELIKNSYDADANWVKVSFIDFDDDFSVNSNSKIVIEDDGCGMNQDIIEKHWLNPATPEKKIRKAIEQKTEKGRILQGEKGIGRFAIFKLGKTIRIITRRKGEDVENVVLYDFIKYDNDFLKEAGIEKSLYLDDLEVGFSQRKPKRLVNGEIELGSIVKERLPHGTIIEISNLKGYWSNKLLEKIQKDIGKMQPIFENPKVSDFGVWIYKDGLVHESQERYKEKLRNYLDTKSVLKITKGHYNETSKSISFHINDQAKTISFDDSDFTSIRHFREYFTNSNYSTECGDFRFEFYIFDFNSDSKSRYYLDKKDKNSIKEHRIYLYRDSIRVFPYGDVEDDWLKIDMYRGTISAGEFLSNDQVVGCVYITQKDNPKLKDKTNREGLIEEGKALSDFISVLQLFLIYLRKKPYEQYLIDKGRKKEFDELKADRPQGLIDDIKKQTTEQNVLQLLDKFEKSYKKEKGALLNRIEKTENLAAVGLSVETASHDVMLFIRKTIDQLDVLLRELMIGTEFNKEHIQDKISSVRGNLSFVETQMKDIQLLFPSTKSKTKNINIKDILEKVYRLYQRVFDETHIRFNLIETGSPLIVKTTDAVLLQVFINLFDNALYWLKLCESDRKVEIYLDGNDNRVIFSDNGPGIKDDDRSYIFEAFYSGKGEDGRGLGLYIARQLLDRYDYTIDLAEFSKDKRLEGANFVLEFVRGEK